MMVEVCYREFLGEGCSALSIVLAYQNLDMLVHLLDYSDEPIAIFYIVVNNFEVSESTFREHMLKPFAALINVNRIKFYVHSSSDIIQGVERPKSSQSTWRNS